MSDIFQAESDQDVERVRELFWEYLVWANTRVNDEFGVAIKGYDTVAYHTEGRPVKGKSVFSFKWNDAVWHFASTENLALFAANPERYAPQYGGY